MWDEYGLGVQPQAPHFTMSYRLGVAQISDKIPKARSAWATIMWWVHIHMHIHSIQRLSNTFYIYNIDVRCIWGECAASITAFHHHLLPWSSPDFWQNSKSLVGMSNHSVVGTCPYAHPQHIKVVKHLLYIYHWCEMNMGWVYSLKHRISPWVIAWE